VANGHAAAAELTIALMKSRRCIAPSAQDKTITAEAGALEGAADAAAKYVRFGS
jgi:hypothetical protein